LSWPIISREIAFGGEAASHVFDMRVEAAVLVDDDHGRKLVSTRRLRDIGADAGGGDGLGLDAAVAFRDGLGQRVVVLQQGQQGGRRRAAAGQQGQAIEKVAAADMTMGKAVIEVDDGLVHPSALPQVSVKTGILPSAAGIAEHIDVMGKFAVAFCRRRLRR
jgi:hypothetical protein